MIIKRAASIPLITHDPYFSIWSSADRLYDKDTTHWSGIGQSIRGYISVANETYCFMGDKQFHKAIEQKYIDVTATATTYYFENEKIGLMLKFTSPLLLDDYTLVSRPCTYVDFKVDIKDDNIDKNDISINMLVSAQLVSEKTDDYVVGDSYVNTSTEVAYKYAFMGKADQKPLGNSGDNITIDWGYAYVASRCDSADIRFNQLNKEISLSIVPDSNGLADVIIAYDDILSINYFGQWRKAYWTNTYSSILEAIGAAFADKEEVIKKCMAVDEDIYKRAMEIGDEEYAFLCNMSYRHAISAHKLITDEEGNIIFLSKENDSNGCIGTVDVSYPSVPLFLLYDTEYVKGMLRPVFKFADCDVWEYDFAPHDVGRYPYAWGQVYGLNPAKWEKGFSGAQGRIFPPFYMYPKNSDIFDLRYQMPVEECGNMLVLTAVVCERDGNTDFARPYMDILAKWTKYLIEYGEDPGEQLCTDDFAGHLSHNVNLSAKAIMGIESYARLLDMEGKNAEAEEYHDKARNMARSWEERAYTEDTCEKCDGTKITNKHYALGFGSSNTWSLKYNTVWDKYFGTKLFSDEMFEREIKHYVDMTNEYGTPLDSRKSYTKSDWIIWCVSFAEDKEKAKALINPVAHYLENTKTRVPFSDWYDTVTSEYVAFIARSVQGGIFMPILIKEK